ncbi:MAG: four helix bundle protein [Chitinophagales bacterium]|nr:four helix bundle protein [Chitinophagales bacterium]
MSKFNSYKDLKIWMKGIELVKEIYSVTSTFPSEENFGLKQQLRRCAVSIPSNIAEGWGRHTNKQFANFLYISRGSLMELETQIYLSKELNYIEVESFDKINNIIIEEAKMINGFINNLKKD